MKTAGKKTSKNVRIGNTKKTSRGTRKVKPKVSVKKVKEGKSKRIQEETLSDYQRAHGWVTDEAQHAVRSGYDSITSGPRRGKRAVENASKSISSAYKKKIKRK